MQQDHFLEVSRPLDFSLNFAWKDVTRNNGFTYLIISVIWDIVIELIDKHQTVIISTIDWCLSQCGAQGTNVVSMYWNLHISRVWFTKPFVELPRYSE